ncbi:hypothetical protein ACFWNT_06165 [Streptomyces sp. NPDC058409]|uniref:hypothetical protein n=1 Tax=Streptomyces sp. NPDC058409 TaxID=3346484 RepID=UPI0036518B67
MDSNPALPEVARLPTTGNRTEDEKRIKEHPMATQSALAYEKGRQRPRQWFSSDRREIVEKIQPGEVSWVEMQPSRERVEGWFLSGKDDYRLHAVIDGPSRAVPDRILQRTGPMSEAEKQRCAASRPMTSTPVGADSAASSADKGRLNVGTPTSPGVRALRTVPLDRTSREGMTGRPSGRVHAGAVCLDSVAPAIADRSPPGSSLRPDGLPSTDGRRSGRADGTGTFAARTKRADA